MAERVTTKEALKKINEQLECSLCFETFKQPKLLPCFHVFCKSPCLEKLVAKDGHSLTCPTCRHIVPLSEKGVAGLQSDFHIDRLFEVRDTFGKVSEFSETQCGSCDDGTATGYCQDCKEFVCDECQAAHKKIKQLRGHQLVSLDELRAQATNLVPLNKAVPHCPKHSENALKIYCETCSVLICTDCTVRLHKDHNYDLVADVLAKHKEELVSSLKPVREKLDKVQQALKDFDTRAKEINDQRATREANIHKEIDQQHQLLDQQRAELVSELEMLMQQKLNSLAAQRNKVEITQVKLTSCLEYAEGGLKTGTDSDILAMKASVLKRIEHFSTKFDTNTLQLETTASVKQQLQQNCQEFLEIADSKALSLEHSHTTGDGLKGAKAGEESTVVFQAMTKEKESFEGELTLIAELEHKNSRERLNCNVVKQGHGLNKISYRPVNRGKHELHLTVNGHPVRGSPFQISVAPSPQSQPVRVIRDLYNPRGTAVNSKGQIIVVEGRTSVSVLTPEGENIRTFGICGSGIGQFNYACGVTVDKEDNIYVAENNNNRIQKFNHNGEFVAAISREGSGKFCLSNPVSICYNHRDNNLYVGEATQDLYPGNRCIQVLTTDLKFLRCFGDYRTGGFCNPYDMTFDNANYLYVIDNYKNHVAVFTAEGRFQRAFSQKTKRQTLIRPSAIAIDNANMVYVSENGPHRVSVFTSQGDYITTFGSRGSNEGQFQGIYGLSVDHNDSIIVSDGNGRLQIY